jgi:hypothetical protein
MMQDRTELLLGVIDRLTPGRRTEIDGGILWNEVLRAIPSLAAAPDRRTQYRSVIEALAAQEQIRLPAPSGPNWDRASIPPIPLKLWRIRPADVVAQLRAHEISWRPELTFVLTLNLRQDALQDLLTIQQFLCVAQDSPDIPIKERSYELFGDEKRLEKLLAGEVGRHLTFAQLRCHGASLIPVHTREDGCSGPVLVVENEAAFESFSRWNQIHAAFSMVVYGRGKEAQKYAAFIADSAKRVGAGAYYFGDLDGHGVQIAETTCEEMRGHGVILQPLAKAYERLAGRTPTKDEAEPTPAVWERGIKWLPPSIAERAIAMFSAKRRVAQEAFGWTVLSDIQPRELFGTMK